MSTAFPILLTACLMAPGVAAAQPAGKPKIVIVSSKGRGGPNLAPQLKKLVEKPLKKGAEIVPFAKYQKAAKKAKVSPKDASGPGSANALGTAVGATHVLFIESQMEQELSGKKKKKVFYASVTLVEVASGDAVFTGRYELKGNKLVPKTATTLVSEVQAALTKPVPPTPVPEETPEPVASEPPPPPDVPPAPPPAEQPVAPAAPEDTTLASAPLDVAPAEPAPPPTDPTAGMPGILSSSEPPPSVTTTEEPSSARRGRWRPALNAAAGGIVLLRKASVKSGSTEPYAYEGPMPGGVLRVDFYPLAIGGDGALYEGIGLNVDVAFMMPRTNPDASAGSTKPVTSSVIDGKGSLAFRLAFWDAATAPSFTLQAGYRYFTFPLSKVGFPGATYQGPAFGGEFHIPFVKQFGLSLGGDYTLATPARGVKKLGGEVEGAYGINAQGCFWLFFAPFEVQLGGRFSQYQASFKGMSSYDEWPLDYENVSLTDRMFGGFAAIGIAL